MKKPTKKNNLWLHILIAMFLGIITGLLFSSDGPDLISNDSAIIITNWLALPGHIFLSLIKMIMIPLIFSSILLGIAGTTNTKKLKLMGLRIAPYFITTTAISITIGVILVSIIKPGNYIDQDLLIKSQASQQEVVLDSQINKFKEETGLRDKIISLIPKNPFDAVINESMLQIVIYAIFLGIALTIIKPSHAAPLIGLARSFQELSMVIVKWAMKLAPAAVFGLLAQITAKVGISAMVGMSVYVLTVILGLLLLLTLYMLIIYFLGHYSPLEFLSKAKEVKLLAFSTSSSAAVMPISLKIAIDKLKIKKSTANFIIPLGATINMDGTAIYQAIAAVFLAQVFGIDLTLTELTVLILTTVGASIGTPSTPGVGIIVLATILSTIGVPTSGIALIIGVDRILDMCRTMVNVTGDLTACVVMNRWLTKKRK